MALFTPETQCTVQGQGSSCSIQSDQTLKVKQNCFAGEYCFFSIENVKNPGVILKEGSLTIISYLEGEEVHQSSDVKVWQPLGPSALEVKKTEVIPAVGYTF